MNRQTLRIIIAAVVTLAWTGLIFGMSLQPATDSHELSGGIADWLVNNVLTSIFGNVENLNHIVRKVAHFTEYAALGVFGTVTLYQTGLRKKSPWAFVYCVLVASIDETIQKFNPGRSGQISDVLLDSAGGLCGILFVVLIVYVIRRRKHEEG